MQKINLIDVGAVGGFDLPWRKHRDKIGRSLSFEPNQPPILSGQHLRYDCAIWNTNGESVFYVSGPNGAGSSLLKQNFDWVKENFEQIRHEGNLELNDTWFERSQTARQSACQVRTLDTVLAELRQTEPDLAFQFLKSDTQSGEFYVLEGARSFLEQDCVGLELELFRFPLYQGVITEEEVKAHLQTLGFRVAGWTGYLNSFNASSDYLFLREQPRNAAEASLIQQIEAIYRPQGEARTIKQVSLWDRVVFRAQSALKTLAG
jgi:FkbM family methyltransferase